MMIESEGVMQVSVTYRVPPAKAGDNIKACGEAEKAKRKYSLPTHT